MITRRTDWIRLFLLVPLLVLAAMGRSRLRVDVENLAMKSVGTESADAAAVREREFGGDPAILFVVSPRAPREVLPVDEAELSSWIGALRERAEVTGLEQRETTNAGEHAIAVTVRRDAEGRYGEAVDSLSSFARESVPPTYRIAVAGVAVTEIQIARAMQAERARILPMIGALLVLVLLVIYRDPILVAGAMLAPLVGVFLVEGLQGVMGWSVDPVSSLLGPAVLTVGVASGVHVIERYSAALRRIGDVVAASAAAARELRMPLLLTLVTTLAGFLGLLTSPIPAVRRFGMLASVGVALAVATTLLLLPSLLRLVHAPSSTAVLFDVPRPADARPVNRSRALASVAVALVLGSAGGWFMRVERPDSDPLSMLGGSDPARVDARRVVDRIGGSDVFELLLPPRPLGRTASPFELLALTKRIGEQDGIVAPAGTPKRSLNGYALLSFLLEPGGAAEREALFENTEGIADAAGWTGATATGLAVRVARDSEKLVASQHRGIVFTLGALLLVMSVGFRSFALGLLGLVPNVFPLLLVQGTLGAIGRPLSVASTMIAIVMLGLVVDDTIHFLHAFRRARGTLAERIAVTSSSVARPIVVTTIVLGVGFSATIVGELGATREFGALAVATLVIALIGDLWLLPALIVAGSRPEGARNEQTNICIEQPPTMS